MHLLYNMKKIFLIIGARPNFMKAFPVYEALKDDFEVTLIHTGQHFDAKMSDVFFNQLRFPKPDIHLSLEKKTKSGDFDDKLYVNNGEYLKDKDAVIQELMNYEGDLGHLGEIRDKLKIEFEKGKPDLVVVFGDVTSTLAAGLAAKILNIDLAHVESGLRSGDMLMPEEVNRVLTDHITKYYFVTEQSGVDNLKEIGVTENVYLVGNTMIDTQKKYLQQALDTKYHETLGVKSKEYVLITLHRPSNVDDMDKLKEIFDDFEELSKTEILVYPIHPRTKNNLEKLGYLKKVQENPNIILDEPLGYLEFTCLMANCKYLVTDSGGLQEESTALDIPCFTLRDNTERPSTLIKNNGTNQLINKISEIEFKKCKGSMDLWDGKSSKRLFVILKQKINSLRVAVGYAHSGKNIGGVRRYIENIQKLSRHNVTLYPSYENDALWRENYDMQVRTDYRNNEIKAKQQEIFDNHDVFHSNVDPIWIKLCEEAQKQGKLWIHTYHNIYMAEDEPDGKLLQWQQEINDIQFNIASKANYKLCVGEWLVDECKKRNIDSIFVPNFIPTDKLSTIKLNNFKNKYQLKEFILFSGDVSVRKNCVEFIKTAKLLPQYKFVLMGTGLTKEEIVKTHNIELTDNVIAMGPLSHTECLEAMNDCSILVMNSFTEGLPTVLIEAMYYETPCIIPEGPDWSKYLLKDNNIGYKYPLGNVENLSEKISEIMKDYKTLPNAKKHVECTFSSNAVISKLDDLYDNNTINIPSLVEPKNIYNSYDIEYLETDLTNTILNKKIHYNYNGIDFMYNNNKKNKKLLILFHGAVNLNVKKPVFYGYNIDPNDYDILSFSDPLIKKYENLELSWFSSSKSCNTFQMITEIIENIKSKYTNILCHGSSGGGFPSLLISSYFSVDCIINNSQLYLSEYYYYKIIKNIVSDIIDIDIEKYIKENGLPRKLYLYQNIYDEEHYNKHYNKFKLFLKSNFDCSNVYFNEFIRQDIGKAIPWYPDVEQYKMDRPKTVNWNVDTDEKKFNKYCKLRRDTVGKHHNSPFPEGVCRYRIFSDILNNKEIDSYKEDDFKKNLLISSLDNKFFIEIVEQLKQDYNVKIDLFHENNHETREELLNWADIIFCEWCEVNALWYSQNKKSNQKLFIRLHRYELFTSFFYDINWKNVNNLIFIAPEMKRVANKHLLQRKYINKDNFEWEFYLKNNNDLFEELDKNNYNKDWAWKHWINNGNKMSWRRPVIKLTDNIDYTEICDEFKHFNGGELIWNYVKTDMFTDLPKLEGSEFNIGIIGILPKIKRPDIALDIIENLIKKDSRYKLVILGKWYTDWIGTSKHKKEIEYYKKLEERINSSELKNHIVVDKFTPEVDKWFQKIGFILSVSDIEGSHQSVAEAMATGTIPLIYGKALTDYKLDEVYPKKYCFYEDNIDKLCDKIYFYSNNKEEKRVISGECKNYSSGNFKIKDIYNQYSKILTNKFKITAICVTLNNGDLITHSILSIVNYIDEILIFDDSKYQDNVYLIYLEKTYDNIKIVRKNFGTDLGKKKQYLNEIASNDIILRWDNDFILYDYTILTKIYKLFEENIIDGAQSLSNLNFKFTLDKLDNSMFCKELYIFRKGFVKFDKYEHYSAYPIVINDKMRNRSFTKDILFLHMSNFKSYENIYFRIKMNPFMKSNYDNYYEYMFDQEYSKKPNYFELIDFKKKQLEHRRKYIYEYHNNWDIQWDMYEPIVKLKEFDLEFDLSKLDKNFIDYIQYNFKHTRINENPIQYNFTCNETDSLTNLFYWYTDNPNKIGNFGDLLPFYIFEKLTGYKHNFVDIRKDNNKFNYLTIGSILNLANNKSIVWGAGIIQQNLNTINPLKICCVRGPRTRIALKNINIDVDEKYGDPALLLPLIYNKKTDKKYKIGIIPDVVDYNEISELCIINTDICMINLSITKTNEDIEQVLCLIRSCEFILTSSLHGIILSNAYNIPVVRFKHNKLAGDDIKFIDYFESVYSDNFICETTFTINECIEKIDDVKKIYIKPDLIEKRQQDLIETCPFVDESLKKYLFELVL